MSIDISRLARIKMLILDVDGILTDCRIFLDSNNEWRRFFSVRDGVGIKRLVESGYQLALITGSKAKDIQERVRILGIHHLYEGKMDKLPSFEDLRQKTGIALDEIAYMGDDYFDVPILERVGFAATVSDAMDEAKEVCHYIAVRPAGNGAVREVCDLIYKHGSISKNLAQHAGQTRAHSLENKK